MNKANIYVFCLSFTLTIYVTVIPTPSVTMIAQETMTAISSFDKDLSSSTGGSAVDV